MEIVKFKNGKYKYGVRRETTGNKEWHWEFGFVDGRQRGFTEKSRISLMDREGAEWLLAELECDAECYLDMGTPVGDSDE